MRPSLVNGLALVAAASIVSLACSSADGRARAAATAAADSTSGAPAPAAAPATASVATDSLSKAADASRIQGSPSAPIWLIEVSDFQCPYCKMWHDETYATVLDKYIKSGKVRMAYVNFPLSMHQHAHEAAVAAMCAGAQGKFWPMHDSLFATQKIWEVMESPLSTFDTLANENHVEMSAWRSCMSNHSTLPLIEADLDRARQTGASSTPSFFVGTMKLSGADANVRGAIDSALKAAAAKPKR